MPRATLPILAHCIGAYKLWHDFVPDIPKTARYTLGGKIDTYFTDTIEYIVSAIYLPRERKGASIQAAIAKLDTLKLFLQIAWEIKALDTKKYQILSEKLYEIGKMLGGWNRQVETSR